MNEIIGVVESIIFQNEENGYVVARLKDNKDIHTIVGIMPYIVEGQNIKVSGEWKLHQKFGQQLSVESCEEIVPNTISGIEKYLSSGIITGIGAITAKRIVEHFGEETLDVLDNDIERLKEVEGIGDKKINIIYESYSKQREVRSIMMFFQVYGITPKQCMKIYKRFGKDSVSVVKENPYKLCDEIVGIGFKTADKIALNLGIERNSSFRIMSGIRYIISEFCMNGHTYMPKDILSKNASEILLVPKEDVEKAIYDSTLEGLIKIEVIEGKEAAFSIPYYYSELGVTKKIVQLIANVYSELKIDCEEEIGKFEKENGIQFAESQKEAIRGAFENGIEIITGGPGTGKTTIINCITSIFESLGMSVSMAAPTGRAAKRMTESTGIEAKTIHRLLELGYEEDEEAMQFMKGEESPLESDVVIVDEASMIDIILMNSLLKAINFGTRLIIVGDVDQLPSVGPGKVLKDLIECNCIKVVRLKEIFRQSEKSMIVVNAHKINSGEMPALNKKDKDFFFLKCEDQEKILDTVIGLINTRLPKFNSNWNKVKDIQILTPMRKGILGVDNLNLKLQEILNSKEKHKTEIKYREVIFRVGDKVMQIKNNYSIKWEKESGNPEDSGVGVFNGDVGYIVNIDKDENVWVQFDDERLVKYETLFLDELTHAYAITIHKSQGSEFPVVIMPIFTGPPLLMNKNLLYTGVTRAKKLVVLVGGERSLRYMINNDKSYERHSALKWRISSIFDIDPD